MSERAAVSLSSEPTTRESIAQNLRDAGVEKGDLVLCHVSLSKIGWVCGAEVAALQALLDTIGGEGTLIMPAHSAGLSDPSEWGNPAVPPEWWSTVRQHLPAFDVAISPTLGVGRVAELLRKWPGAMRSNHPTVSFSGLGPLAATVLSGHSLRHGLGENSPLGVLYRLGAKVLLIGCGFEACTAFHLAEYRAPGGVAVRKGAPILVNEKRQWVEYDEIELDEEVFRQLGDDFAKACEVSSSSVGAAQTRLFALRAAVDFAQAWVTRHRRAVDQ